MTLFNRCHLLVYCPDGFLLFQSGQGLIKKCRIELILDEGPGLFRYRVSQYFVLWNKLIRVSMNLKQTRTFTIFAPYPVRYAPPEILKPETAADAKLLNPNVQEEIRNMQSVAGVLFSGSWMLGIVNLSGG